MIGIPAEITYFILLGWQLIGIACIVFIMIHLCVDRRMMFHSKKNPNSIAGNLKNQNLVLRTLISMLICDFFFTISDLIYTAWEYSPRIIPAFRKTEENMSNIHSIYWLYLRFGRSVSIFSFCANLSSACWAVSFAISLFLLLSARGKNIPFIYFYDIVFHLFATVGSFFIFIGWVLYRNLTTEFLFHQKYPEVDIMIVSTFYLFAALTNVILIFIDIFVYLLIWRMLTKSFKRYRKPGRNLIRISELKIVFRMSSFMLPFIIIGLASCITFFAFAIEGYFKVDISGFESIAADIHTFIVSCRAIMNAAVYGFNVGRLDRLIVKCCLCILRPLRKNKDKKNILQSESYYSQFDDNTTAIPLTDKSENIPLNDSSQIQSDINSTLLSMQLTNVNDNIGIDSSLNDIPIENTFVLDSSVS